MKKRHNPMVEGYTKRPLKGRAKFIRKLQAAKVEKNEALAKAQSRFNVSAKAFNEIWS